MLLTMSIPHSRGGNRIRHVHIVRSPSRTCRLRLALIYGPCEPLRWCQIQTGRSKHPQRPLLSDGNGLLYSCFTIPPPFTALPPPLLLPLPPAPPPPLAPPLLHLPHASTIGRPITPLNKGLEKFDFPCFSFSFLHASPRALICLSSASSARWRISFARSSAAAASFCRARPTKPSPSGCARAGRAKALYV